MITHNREEYTRKTLKYLKDTITVPSYIVVVDNLSTDGTRKYLKQLSKGYLVDKVILNDGNYYPGKATNIGWYEGLKEYPEATHLMRLDNDMHLEPSWDIVAKEYFDRIPELGQLGIDHDALDHPKAKLREQEINGMILNPWPGCVGGPNIIRRKIWDMGVRYSEMMWDDGRNSPAQEDSDLSKTIKNLGYLVGHMTERLAWTFANESNWSDYPEYYEKTMSERGYLENVNKIKEMK